MSRIRQFLARLRAHFLRREWENDMAEEMKAHLEHLARENIALGLTPKEAHFAAQRKFGGVVQFQEECRDETRWRPLEECLRNVRFATRIFKKRPGLTAVAIVTLALCLGANAAIFSVVNGLLIKPLPFLEPERIVQIHNIFDARTLQSNLVQYLDYKANAASFDMVGLWKLKDLTLGEDGSEERVTAAICTAEMFDVLGLKPLLGQFFTTDNSRFGEDHVVVLTESYWKTHYNSDPGILTKSLRVENENYRILGVAPVALEAFDTRVKIIKPMAWKATWIKPADRYAIDTPLYGRIKRGIALSQAQAEAQVLERRFYDAAPLWNKQLLDRAVYKIAVESVPRERANPTEPSVLVLQGGALLVLLIGCVNVAHLLLALADGRQGELGLRLAVGATGGAVVRQIFVESFVLAFTGGLLGTLGGICILYFVNRFLVTLIPGSLPFTVDWHVVVFIAGLTLLVAVLLGLFPTLTLLRTSLGKFVHATNPNVIKKTRPRNAMGILLVSQVAVALVLLSGAGLLVHSYANAVAIAPGFDPANMVTARIALGRPYWNARGAVFQKQLIQALKEIPGVTDVALASGVPFEGGLDSRLLTLRDSSLSAETIQPKAYEIGVSVGYFEALRIQLLDGRFFNERDLDGQQYVVDERFAQRYFPGDSAVGKHFTFMNRNLPAKAEDWPTIIGVVRQVHHNGVEDKSETPFSYYPFLLAQPEEPNLFVRSSLPLENVVASIREKLLRLDPGIPLYHIESLGAAISGSLRERRAVMLVLVGFASLALFLSALGLYGVLAFDVSRRTKEIGIRCAVGASRNKIIQLIVLNGLWKTTAGLGFGLTVAVLISRLVAKMLFQLQPTDPWTYAVVSLLLLFTTSLACFLPAQRAAAIAPSEALRRE